MKILLLLYLSLFAHPQTEVGNGDLDFWIGKWAVSWEGGSGTNTISTILNDKIIQEEFIVLSGKPADYKGLSYTAFSKNENIWKQTWIDSQGAYLDFTGGKEGDRVILSRKAMDPEGKEFHQRMVFYNIKKDRFDWQWQRSDDGENWNTQWHITYNRIK